MGNFSKDIQDYLVSGEPLLNVGTISIAKSNSNSPCPKSRIENVTDDSDYVASEKNDSNEKVRTSILYGFMGSKLRFLFSYL